MPYFPPNPQLLRHGSTYQTTGQIKHASSYDNEPVGATVVEQSALARLHREVTKTSRIEPEYSETHSKFRGFLHDQIQCEEEWNPRHRGVCFEDVTTYATRQENQKVKTLATALWRTLTLQDLYEWTFKSWIPRKSVQSTALISGFSGVVRNGEMMLVLGNPGSGCSTFLRTVGNEHSTFEKVTGLLSYSGVSAQDITKSYRGEVSYVPEEDVHFPTLTVRQTLEFALRAKTPRRFHNEIPAYLDMYGRVFGMSHVMGTLVGNEFIRGISGGERKRVSIMESLAVDSAVVAWDNSTRGLDAASAVKYAQSLRIMTDVTGKATIVTLYQASDEVYELMDKVMLVDQGRMLYYGSASKAVQYFEELGYLRHERQTIADFLTSVTSPDKRAFRDGCELKAPKGTDDLAKAFLQSSHHARMNLEITAFKTDSDSAEQSENEGESNETPSNPFKAAVKVKKSKYVPASSVYTTSFIYQTRLCLLREWWQTKQYLFPIYIRIGSILINALLISSMFYDQPLNSDGIYSRGGFMFYSAILIGWIQLAELEGAFEGRAVIGRHKRFAMVRPSVVGLAKVVVDLVVVIVETLIYAIVAYFIAGLKLEPGAFFIYVLILYTVSVCFTQIYRLFAAISASFELALRYCGLALLAFMVTGGYLLPLTSLLNRVPWIGWSAYINPVMYGFEALIVNEFQGLNFTCQESSLVPRGTGYSASTPQTCAYDGARIGEAFVLGEAYARDHFGFAYDHVWRNFGILIAFTLALVMATLCCLERFDWSNDKASAGFQRVLPWVKAKNNSNDEEKVVARTSHHQQQYRSSSEETLKVTIQATPSVFTWKNLDYRIPYEKGERVLLNNVSGYCKPGEMTALVGASGAGKSTLLTVLSQQQKVGTVAGSLTVDGRSPTKSFARNIGFCGQMDIHDETSTIREAFAFSALLRQDAQIPKHEKLAYVDQVLDLLNLAELQNVVIGSLSLELKRRTTIGVELCAKPKLLMFLDEPTSGLDSQGALTIVKLLRGLADSGQAILCTIHQASQQQFELFDRVLALNPGGTVFYNGPVGSRGRAVFEYFERNGCSAPDGKNVADFIIEVGTGSIRQAEDEKAIDWSNVWTVSSEAKQVEATVDEIRQSRAKKTSGDVENRDDDTEFAASIKDQVLYLTQRSLKQFWRIPEYPYARLYASFLHALFNGLTFLQLGDSVADLQSVTYSLFLVLMLVPEFINGISMRFIANRNVWLEKEYPSRVYGWFAFATSQVVAEIPYALVGAVVFYLVFYFMVGLPLGAPAGYVFAMVIFFHLFATSWGQWIAAMSRDATVAANLMPFFVIMCELFNGVLRPVQQMPAVWRYTMYYVAPFTYWIGGNLAIVLTGRPVQCTAAEHIYFPLSPDSITSPSSSSSSISACADYAASFLSLTTGYISDEASNSTSCAYCPYSKGEDFLATYSLSSNVAWRNFAIFAGFVVSNYCLTYMLVWLNSPQFRFKSLFSFPASAKKLFGSFNKRA